MTTLDHLMIHAMELSANTVVITNNEGEILWCNPSYAQHVGYRQAEIIGSKPSRFKSGKHGEEFYAQMWQQLKSGAVWKGEIINRAKNGELFILDLTITPILDPLTQAICYIGMGQDITDKKKLQMEMLKNDHLTSLGKLASGIAHEVNNPLSTVYASLEIIDEALLEAPHVLASKKDRLKKLLLSSRQSLTKAVQILRDFSFVSQETAHEPSPIDLYQILNSVISVLGKEIKLKSKLTLEIKSTPPVIATDTQISQLLLNLLTTALDLLPSDGYNENQFSISLYPLDKHNCLSLKVLGDTPNSDLLQNRNNPFLAQDKNIRQAIALGIADMLVANLGGKLEVLQCGVTEGKAKKHCTQFNLLLPAYIQDTAAKD